MDEKRLEEIERRYTKGDMALSQLITAKEEPEILHLARLGLELEKQKATQDLTVELTKEHLRPGIARIFALAEWAEKHAVPALKDSRDMISSEYCSHGDSTGRPNECGNHETCYANFIFKALEEMPK